MRRVFLQVEVAYKEAYRDGTWELSSYAMSNAEEYWAEATGVWFDVNRGAASGK